MSGKYPAAVHFSEKFRIRI